jgi:predicted GH43/DUF377 family glycosyl hydrolase
MKWIKKGLIFKADDIKSDFIKSHAQIPTVLVLEDRLRVYFATRPKQGLSMTTYMDLDIKDPKNILYIHEKPILELGKDGMFDEHGIMPNFIYKEDNTHYMHYVGWSRRESIPYSNWMGLAKSDDNGKTFSKMFNGPFLDRTKDEVYSSTGTWMIKRDDIYFVWYAKGTSWQKINGQYENQYNIVSAISRDGINWEHTNQEIFNRKDELEASTRPTVLLKNNIYHMWFCYRSLRDFRDGNGSYRIGYAWSDDLKTWHREDAKAGIDVSEDGWDSKMIAYPYIVETTYGTYMFYNGNGFGQSGFGYAVLEE